MTGPVVRVLIVDDHPVVREGLRGMLAGEAGIEVSLRPFTVDEVMAAKEAFMTAASTLVMPVTSIDGHAIGDGRPGPVGMRLRVLYEQNARATAR